MLHLLSFFDIWYMEDSFCSGNCQVKSFYPLRRNIPPKRNLENLSTSPTDSYNCLQFDVIFFLLGKMLCGTTLHLPWHPPVSSGITTLALKPVKPAEASLSRRSATAWLALGAFLAPRACRAVATARRSSGGSGFKLRQNSEILTVAFPAFEGGDEVMTEVQDLITEELVPAGPETQWTGLWRVSYAPHIRTLGSLGLTKFDVYYDILPCEKGETSPKIRSYVRFEGPFWRGWLNSSGVISTLSEKEVQVGSNGRGG